MGKSKSRILRKGINDRFKNISRDDAISYVLESLSNNDNAHAKELITMFGLNPEELLEAGADYEAVVALKNIFW